MGFEGDLVQEALQSTDGDVERALDLLLGAQQGTQHGSTFFSFSDHFTGNTVSLLQIPLLPNHQRALPQIKCPLELVKTSAMFFAQRSPTIGNKRPRQPLPPLNFMSVDYHACVIQRVMFGCVAIACQRLATTPGNVAVNSRTTWRLAELVMERVTRGRVSRVQVRLQRCSCCCLFVCVLTFAAANAGWYTGRDHRSAIKRVPCRPSHTLFAARHRRHPWTLL